MCKLVHKPTRRRIGRRRKRSNCAVCEHPVFAKLRQNKSWYSNPFYSRRRSLEQSCLMLVCSGVIKIGDTSRGNWMVPVALFTSKNRWLLVIVLSDDLFLQTTVTICTLSSLHRSVWSFVQCSGKFSRKIIFRLSLWHNPLDVVTRGVAVRPLSPPSDATAGVYVDESWFQWQRHGLSFIRHYSSTYYLPPWWWYVPFSNTTILCQTRTTTL